jgi:hypothetical protein
MTWATVDQTDYIVLYALSGQYFETVVSGVGAKKVAGHSGVKAKTVNGTTIISGTASGVSVISLNKTKVIVADKDTAYTFWVPPTSTDGTISSLPSKLNSIIVTGPYLVRNVTVYQGNATLNLHGDIDSKTTIDIIAPKSFQHATWNGRPLALKKSDIGTLRGTINFEYSNNITNDQISLPDLKTLEWKCIDTLPELQA